MAVNKDFVVKNGLEVNRLLIRTNTSTNRVGINTDIINATFEVNGSILSKSLSVVGVTTFSTVNVTNSLQLSGSAGANGQYLRSTGTGVTWANFPSTRTSQTFTAITGQTLFPFSYTIGLLDVFLNGTKLSASDFNASDGNNIILNVPCIGGETVEVIGYSATTIGITTTIGISGITISEEGSPVGNIGSINAIDFVGAAVTAVGSGNSVTVYISDTNSANQWEITSSGINTSSNVGIGTTISTSALTVNGDVLITGVTTAQNIVADSGSFTGIVTALDLYGRDLILSSNVNAISLFATDANLSGIVTASGFIGDGSALSGIITSIIPGTGISVSQSTGIVTITGNQNYWEENVSGIHTTSNVGIGTTIPDSALAVVGNVNVSGVVTATEGFISIGNTTPIQISLVGNQLTFIAVGIGSTTFTLF